MVNSHFLKNILKKLLIELKQHFKEIEIEIERTQEKQSQFLSLCYGSLYNWRSQWHPTPVLLPGKSQGQRSLVGCSPRGHQELDTIERLHFDFSLSCIGGGNGNLLQCSCLENPMDRGAWWAAFYGVAQTRTRLKRLSSSRAVLDVMTSETLCTF